MNEIPSSQDTALSRAADIALITLAVMGALAILFVAKALLFPIVLAILVALALGPVVRFLYNKLRLPTVVASAVVVLAILVAGINGVYLLSGPAAKWIHNAPTQFEKVERKIYPVKKSVEDFNKAAGELEKLTEGDKTPKVLKVEVARPALTTAVLNATTEALLQVGIAISCLFLLLAFGDDALKRLSDLAAASGRQSRATGLAATAENIVSRYLFTFSLINAGLGTVIGLGLWAIGMPNPLLWGVMAACLNFIPYLGLLTGSCIVFFVAFVTFDSPLYALLAPAIYLGANMVEANAITPVLLGKAMELHVLIVYAGILLWGWLWGIGGVLIAVPLMATLRLVWIHLAPDAWSAGAKLWLPKPTLGSG